jgi:hypothetical protein
MATLVARTSGRDDRLACLKAIALGSCKMKLGKVTAAALIALSASVGLGATAHAALIGPVLPYLGFSDSPFFGKSFSYFYLETFEDHALNTPGVTASAGFADGPGAFIDSVDGGGPGGVSWFSGCGSCGVTFTFDAGVLGKLPTSAGIVWTDGDGPNRTFEAFDQNGVSLGTIIDSTPLFFSSGGDGDADNYRFFGVTNPGGISKIFMANDGGGIEVDHLQYGLNTAGKTPGIPEPGLWAMMLVGFAALGSAARSRRARLASF